MKPQSRKARAIAEERAQLRWSLVAMRGSGCEFPGCTQGFSDMHEILSRARGGDPTDPANILLLCRGHHSWVTTHPKDATALGMLRSRTAEEHIARTSLRLAERLTDPDTDTDTRKAS